MAKPKGYWRNWDNVKSELQSYAKQNNNVLPPYTYLFKQNVSLCQTINRYWGKFQDIAEKASKECGFQLQKNHEYYQSWTIAKNEIHKIMQSNNGLFPDYQLLIKTNKSLVDAIAMYHGGIDAAREKIGYDLTSKQCSQCKKCKPVNQFRLRKKSNGQFRDSICNNCSISNLEVYRKTPKGYVRKLLPRIRHRANKKHIKFDLDQNWILDRLEIINWKCEITGIPFDLSHNENSDNVRGGYDCPFSLSIDRIDSSKGYTKANVQFVINWVNWSKSNLSSDDFINLCRKVVEFNNEIHSIAL